MVNQYFTVSSLHMRCPIHLLQLAIKDALDKHDDINRLLNKVGKVVKSVRKSCLNTEETDRLGVRPTTACPTRWSSQLRMIESVLKLFDKDPLWQSKIKSTSANLTPNDVHWLTHLVEVLSPLSDNMQRERGMILPAVVR